MPSAIAGELPNRSALQCQRVAEYPFDIRAANVVFRTADGVNFYVYQEILSLASPYFANMLSPKDRQTNQDNHASSEPIVIPESSGTLDPLLRFCYPLEPPEISGHQQLELVLEAAIKYQVTRVVSILRASLSDLISSFPSTAFAIACRLQLEDEARAAAIGRISITDDCKGKKRAGRRSRSMIEYSPEMASIPAGILYRLRYYRRKGSLPTHFIQPVDPSNSQYQYHYECDKDGSWLQLDQKYADVILRSLDGVDFPFHRLLLELSLAGQLLESLPDELGVSDTDSPDALAIIQVGLTSDVLRDLLRMCHPSARYELDDPHRLWKLSQAAIKYDMTLLVETLRKQATRLISKRPLAICLAAMRNGWSEEAKAAARCLADRHSIDEYEPILEDIPSSLYHSLLTYHSSCVEAVLKAVKEHAPDSNMWKELWRSRSDPKPTLLLWPLVEEELRLENTCSNVLNGPPLPEVPNNAIVKVPLFGLAPVNIPKDAVARKSVLDLASSADALNAAITRRLDEIKLDCGEETNSSPTSLTMTTVLQNTGPQI